MNLRNLFLLESEHPEQLREASVAADLDPVVVVGTVKLLIANDGNLASLSPRQRLCYDRVIAPLIAE